jgi:hypothetical protein
MTLCLVLNDSIFLLDEALEKVKEIHRLESIAADPIQFNALSVQEREVRISVCLHGGFFHPVCAQTQRRELNNHTTQLRLYFRLAIEAIRMLHYMTARYQVRACQSTEASF